MAKIGVQKTGPIATHEVFTALPRPAKLVVEIAGKVMAEISRKGLASVARAAVDLRVGRVLTDAEWARARATLIEFVTLMRKWEQAAAANDSASCPPQAA